MYLLDVNVLIALLDPIHVHHQKVTNWYLGHCRDGWATCPLTENGFIRIFGHSNYPEGPGSIHDTSPYLAGFPNSPVSGVVLEPDDKRHGRSDKGQWGPGYF